MKKNIFEQKTFLDRILAFALTLAIILVAVPNIEFIKPIFAADIPVSDEERGISLNFGWGESCSNEPLNFYFFGGTNSKTAYTKIAYSGTSIAKLYKPEELVITVKSPFNILNIGADKYKSTTKSHEFSYQYKNGVCILTNNIAMGGEENGAFDGYITIYWNITQDAAFKGCGQTSTYESQLEAKQGEITCNISSTIDELNLSAASAPYTTSSDNYSYYLIKYRNGTTASKFNSETDITPDYFIGSFTFHEEQFSGFMRSNQVLVAFIPNDVLPTSNDFEKIEVPFPQLDTIEGYTAYYVNSNIPIFSLLFPKEIYRNNTAQIYLYSYVYKDKALTVYNTKSSGSLQLNFAYDDPVEVDKVEYDQNNSFEFNFFETDTPDNKIPDGEKVKQDYNTVYDAGEYLNKTIHNSYNIGKYYFTTVYTSANEEIMTCDNIDCDYVNLSQYVSENYYSNIQTLNENGDLINASSDKNYLEIFNNLTYEDAVLYINTLTDLYKIQPSGIIATICDTTRSNAATDNYRNKVNDIFNTGITDDENSIIFRRSDIYFPVYDYYIAETSADVYSVLVENIPQYNVANIDTDKGIALFEHLEGEDESSDIPHDIEHIAIKEFCNPRFILCNNNIDNNSVEYQNYIDLSIPDVNRDSFNGVIISSDNYYHDGFYQETRIDFLEIDSKFDNQPITLTPDQYEYTYITVPTSDFSYVNGTDTNSDCENWTIYIKTIYDSDYQLFASSTDGYTPGEKLDLPEKTISIKCVAPVSFEKMWKISKSDSFYLTELKYGAYVYPEAIQDINMDTRGSYQTFSYTSEGIWGTLPNNTLYDMGEQFSYLFTQFENESQRNRFTPREIERYGMRLGTHGSILTLNKKVSRSYTAINLSKISDINAYEYGFSLTSSTSFSSGEVKETVTSDNKYDSTLSKIDTFTDYLLIPKYYNIDFEHAQITTSSDIVLDSTRNSIGQFKNEYINSHCRISIDDMTYDDFYLVCLDFNFSDNPLINSYSTNSNVVSFDYYFPMVLDIRKATQFDHVYKYTELQAGYAFSGHEDNFDVNQNGLTRIEDEQMMYIMAPHVSVGTGLSGYKAVAIDMSSEATYNYYCTEDGSVNIGDVYKYRIKVKAASNDINNISVYDKIELENTSEWQGKFKNVSVELNNSELSHDKYKTYYSLDTGDLGKVESGSAWIELTDETSTEIINNIKQVALVFDESIQLSESDNFFIYIDMIAPVDSDKIGKFSVNNCSLISSIVYEDGTVMPSETLISNNTKAELLLKDASVCLRLRDSVSRNPIQNCEFKLYKKDGTLVDTFTTDINGCTVPLRLTLGKYYYSQITTEKGYSMTDSVYPFTVGLNFIKKDLTTIEAYNYKKNALINIQKTDSKDGTVLKGAELMFVSAVNSNLTFGPYTTDENGFVSCNIPWGDYYINETVAPENYTCIKNYFISVGEDYTETPLELNLKDERILGSATVNLVCRDDMKNISGATYELYKGVELIDTLTTNGSGCVSKSGLEWGEYTFKLVSIPDCYTFEDTYTPSVVNINKDNLYPSATDYIRRKNGAIKLIKTDKDNSSVFLEGAKYALYDADGTEIRNNIITDENGEALIENISWGSYYLQEIEPPFGYSLNDGKIIINVDEISVVDTQTIGVMDNSTSGSLKINKKVKAADVEFNNEKPVFLFKITGTDINDISYSFFAKIEIKETSTVKNGFLSDYVVISDLPQGTWNVEEQPVIRYNTSEAISDQDPVPTGSNSVSIVLDASKLNSEITFTNEKLYKEGFSSNDLKINSFIGENEVIAVIANTKKIGYSPNQTITLDDIILTTINENNEEEILDKTQAGITIPEINTKYEHPGTYLYPITITIGENTFSTVVKIEVSAFTYVVDSKDNTATITGYTGADEIVKIPSEIDGYTVAGLGTGSSVKFKANTKEIILPPTLKKISSNAISDFYTHPLLSKVVISKGTRLDYIDTYSISASSYRPSGYISSPFEIVVEDDVVIKEALNYAFGNDFCNGSSYPSSIELTFGENSYIEKYYNSSLASISPASGRFSFPEGTKYIMDYAIGGDGNKSLKTIDLPYSLEYVSGSLTRSSVETINTKAINACCDVNVYNRSTVLTINAPFYIPLFCGQYYQRVYNDKVKYNYDISLLDGIEWENKNTYNTFIYEEKTDNMSGLSNQTVALVNCTPTNNDVPAVEIPDTVEYVFGVSGKINFGKNSSLKEISLWDSSYDANYDFYNNTLPETVVSCIFSKNRNTNPFDKNIIIPENSSLEYSATSMPSPDFRNSNIDVPGFYNQETIIPEKYQMGAFSFVPTNTEKPISVIKYSGNNVKLCSAVNGINETFNLRNIINNEQDSSFVEPSLFNYYNTDNIRIDISDNITNIPSFMFCNSKDSYVQLNVNPRKTGVYCETLKIPSSVKRVEESAFKNISCRNIYIAEGIKNIETYAFYSNYAKEITHSYDYAYLYVYEENLCGVNGENVMILPDSLLTIDSMAFGPSDTIQKIYFGKNLKYIHPQFINIDDYPSLSELELSSENTNYVLSADKKTIYNKDCSEIIFTIDSSLTPGSSSTEKDIMTIENGVLIRISNPSENIVIPEGVEELGVYSLSGIVCNSISLPESLVKIDDYAFYNSCIKNIMIPSGVEYIGDKAFSDSNTSKIIPYLTQINAVNCDDELFDEIKSSSTSISIAENSSLKSIGYKAFSNYKLTGNINLSKNVSEIGTLAFAGDILVNKITFEENSQLKEIPFGAFYLCGSLYSKINNNTRQICFSELPDSLEIIDDMAFANTEFENYDFRDLEKLEYIGDFAFKECVERNNAPINDNDTRPLINEMKYIVIPRNVKNIGIGAFEKRENSYNQATDNIGAVYILSDDVNIESITAFGFTMQERYSSLLGFQYNLENPYCITIFGNSEKLHSTCDHYGWTYNQYVSTDNKSGFTYDILPDNTAIITGITPDIRIKQRTLVVPDVIEGHNVSKIGDMAFINPISQYCVDHLVIEDGIKFIGEDLFVSESVFDKQNEYRDVKGYIPIYPKLTSAILPNTLIELGPSFRNCKNLKTMNFPGSIKSYTGEKILYNTGITEITLPNNIEEIPNYAFYSDTLTVIASPNLKKIGSYGVGNIKFSGECNITELGDYAISKIPVYFDISKLEKMGKCSIPSGYYYTLNQLTITFDNLLDIPDNSAIQAGKTSSSDTKICFPKVRTIGESGLLGCGAGSYEFSNNLTIIKKNAFYQNRYLTSLVLPDSVTEIGAEAFRECSKLESIIIPDSVSIIQSNLFRDCSAIKSITLPNNNYELMSQSLSSNYKLTEIKNLDKAKILTGGLQLSSTYPGTELVYGCEQIGGLIFSGQNNVKTLKFTNPDLVFTSRYKVNLYNYTNIKDVWFACDGITSTVNSNNMLFAMINQNTTFHVPVGTKDKFLEDFKTMYSTYSKTTTMYDWYESGLITVIEDYPE